MHKGARTRDLRLKSTVIAGHAGMIRGIGTPEIL